MWDVDPEPTKWDQFWDGVNSFIWSFAGCVVLSFILLPWILGVFVLILWLAAHS